MAQQQTAQPDSELIYKRQAVSRPGETKRLQNAGRQGTASENPDSEEDSTFFFGDGTGPMLDEPELLAQNSGSNNSGAGGGSLSGFAETAWGTTFSEVRTRLASLATSDTTTEKVEIVAMELNKYILVKRNDILYRYNFYLTPYEVARLQNHELTKEEHNQKDARLYHVKVILPFIEAGKIKDKLSKLHGPNTKTTVDEKKKDGANIWELGAGLIFQWYEPYHKKPYTRSVDFLSTEMSKQILAEYAQYFDARERLLLQKVLLK